MSGMLLTQFAEADPGFPRGAPTLEVGVDVLQHFFAENCMKMKMK